MLASLAVWTLRSVIMTEDYKPTPTHHLWVANGLVGALAAFFPLMISIVILDGMGWWDETNEWVLALVLGSYGGAIMRHIND